MTERRFVDLSHTVEDGMVTYRGLPPPRVSAHLSHAESRSHYAEGTEFHVGRIEMVANTGTYLDSPFHRYPGEEDLSQLPLDAVADLEGMVIDAERRSGRAVDRSFVEGRDVAGKAVLVRTGWDARWGTESYFEGHPFLTRGAAEHLAAAGAKLVGIDSLNVDDTAGGERPVHSILLAQGIPVVEHLSALEPLIDRRFRFFAVPVKVRGLGSFPVRAFALLESDPFRET